MLPPSGETADSVVLTEVMGGAMAGAIDMGAGAMVGGMVPILSAMEEAGKLAILNSGLAESSISSESSTTGEDNGIGVVIGVMLAEMGSGSAEKLAGAASVDGGVVGNKSSKIVATIGDEENREGDTASSTSVGLTW
ncbi:hypothetical protein FGB62_153g09 [Gracilaria domingensis]|nr:hypothetical protein FGB62_153g09 [Gracilaria domingensis]